MKQLKQAYRRMKVGELKAHPQNPRVGDVAAIGESVEANGFYGALIVQRSTGFVLAGNHRLQVAQDAGAKTVPCLVVDCDDETARRLMLIDNRASDKASYDERALLALLEEDDGEDGLLGTGYSGDDVAALLKGIDDEPLVDEPKARAEDSPVIAYSLIFDSIEQQERWFAFLRTLRDRYPESETIASRIDRAITESLAPA